MKKQYPYELKRFARPPLNILGIIKVICPACNGSGTWEDTEFGTGRKVEIICLGCNGRGFEELEEVAAQRVKPPEVK